MADGMRDAAGVADWIGQVLRHGGGWSDAVLLSLALRGHDPDMLADTARALAGSTERLTETMDQGRAFAATLSALGHAMPARPLPIAVGVAARDLGLPPR